MTGVVGGSGLLPAGTHQQRIWVCLKAVSVAASARLRQSAASSLSLSYVFVHRIVKYS